MSARAIAIHGNEMSGERRANLEIKSECPALLFSALPWQGQGDNFLVNNYLIIEFHDIVMKFKKWSLCNFHGIAYFFNFFTS